MRLLPWARALLPSPRALGCIGVHCIGVSSRKALHGSRERPPPRACVLLTGPGMATLSAQNHGRKMGAGPTCLLGTVQRERECPEPEEDMENPAAILPFPRGLG